MARPHPITSALLLAMSLSQTPLMAAETPVKYILDTDIASDCDDAGAMAVAHALADANEAEILAVMVSTGGPYSAPAVSAINTWYGRGAVPIGTLKQPKFWAGGGEDEPSGAANFESYTPYLAREFPTKLKSGEDAPDAVKLYRQVLAAQPDNSVVINTIGPLINLANLLETKGDEVSPLTGPDLVRAKVRLLVITGGKNPQGTSSNFSKAGAGPYAKAVIDGWPGRVVFVGNEVGGTIKSGWPKADPDPKENPARAAYRLFHKGDSAKKRDSWDQAGVLFAIRGLDRFFELVEDGIMVCDESGKTEWRSGVLAEDDVRDHAYLRKITEDDEIRFVFEDLMQRPARSQMAPAP